ncbi:MAG: methyltransferase [Omnitrophica WOR_2 bacterium GWA2_47_8]|nr:MAG: methyltransferase [Omnitrophica WOR_2 bacterium GWA2_47_8]
MNFDSKQHWEKVYNTKKPAEVSWYQNYPALSMDLIAFAKIDKDQKVIDVGGGASVLVDALLDKGFKDVTVLDISSKAIQHARERLGQRAQSVQWIEADITQFDPPQQYDVWHDRAVFHFLTQEEDRKKYISALEKAVKAGGHVVIGTFSLEGPPKCSGLDVERYDPQKMQKELGGSFEFIKSADEIHVTPWNSEQKFTYFFFKRA